MEDEYLQYATSMDSGDIDRLVRKYWGDIWNYVFLLVKNHHSADDVTQETFIRAFQALQSFRGEASVKTWLLRIARNTALNHQKSAFIRRVILVDWFRGTFGSTPSAENEFFHKREADHIWERVMELPIKLREVLVLEARCQLTMVEIAGLLQLSEGTVKSRLFRARAKLTKLLKEGNEDART
jgi:RNA polymerase sigma-70 factor, ECF subfamily